MASPKRNRVNPARKYEKLFIPISVHRATSAAAKAAGFWGAGALVQASIAYLKVMPSTAWRTVNRGRRHHRSREAEGGKSRTCSRPCAEGVVEGYKAAQQKEEAE